MMENMDEMNYEINTNPHYSEFPIREFQGNPLIEALPLPAKNAKEATLWLGQKPYFDERERELAPCFRKLLPSRLLHFMYPTKQHIRMLDRIYNQVVSGYRWRNPKTVLGQKLLYGEQIFTPAQQVPANISLLTGLSGMGKSTLIRAIMRAMGKPIIRHSVYKDAPFTETQILYLMRNVPDQCSSRALCKSFGKLTAKVLGHENYARELSKRHLSKDDYVSILEKIVANHHVGALVIDEFQNLSMANSGGKEEVIRMITNMRDQLGVPIILVGTYRVASILKENASIARRLMEGGFHELQRPADPSDESWGSLCRILWPYQWIQCPQELTDEMVETLYDCSQGITGIMLNIFVTAQNYAIDEEIETITPALIRKVYQESYRPLHHIIQLLRENNPEVLRQYDDLYFDAMAELNKNSIQNRITGMKSEMDLKIMQLSDSENLTSKHPKKKVQAHQAKKSRPMPERLHEALRESAASSESIF